MSTLHLTLRPSATAQMTLRSEYGAVLTFVSPARRLDLSLTSAILLSNPGPIGPEGPTGPTGPQGASIAILGTLPSTSDLPPTAAIGAAYVIDGDVWSFNGAEWVNAGPLRGPQGIQGEQGIQGLKGDQGDKGDKGDTGDAGPPGSNAWADITDKPTDFPPSAHSHSAATTSAAGFMSAADKTKLNGIAASATANSADAALRDRATHTGAQAIGTVTGLQGALDGKQAAITGQIAGLRNKIINGDFSINQRSYVSGAATTAGQYTLDRWKVTSTAGVTFSTTANKTTVTIPAGQTLQQVIEGLNLQSGTYVVSWEGTAQGRIGAGAYGSSGFTAAITGGTDTAVQFGAGTVANVQLEIGAQATPFESRLYGLELILCQRYYYRESSNGVSASPYGGHVQMLTTTQGRLLLRFPTRMRARPTALEQSGVPSDFQINHGSANTLLSGGPTFSNATDSSAAVDLAVSSGLVVGQVGLVRAASTNNTYLAWSAEL